MPLPVYDDLVRCSNSQANERFPALAGRRGDTEAARELREAHRLLSTMGATGHAERP